MSANTTTIYGKSAPKKPIYPNNPNAIIKDTHTNNRPNVAVIEDKINSGVMTLHPLIDKKISLQIQSSRNTIKNGEKTLTQKDLASLANLQKVTKGITSKDIGDIESGNIRLTTENKLKIQAVNMALKKLLVKKLKKSVLISQSEK